MGGEECKITTYREAIDDSSILGEDVVHVTEFGSNREL
jgi:hypothetical protein